MPIRLGIPELLIVLLIVVLIFGVGKVKDIGTAIRDFRKSLKDDDEPAKEPEKKEEKKEEEKK
jgi:sec-independent protein translocase protein TatA